MREVTAVKHINFAGSGTDWTFIHNPMFDGPLENYKNRDDCEVTTLKIEEDGLPKV
jgi:hypothetical protein